MIKPEYIDMYYLYEVASYKLNVFVTYLGFLA